AGRRRSARDDGRAPAPGTPAGPDRPGPGGAGGRGGLGGEEADRASAALTTSVEGDEAVGSGDHVGQHHEAAVDDAVEVLQRDAAPLAAVGADEELGAAGGEPADARVAERADGVVDEVEIENDPAAERFLGERDRGLELGMAGGGEQ